MIGGGPAGSTAATLLARMGWRVVLAERERFPRFQIGESLLPMNNDLFEKLGVLDRMQTIDSFPKYGAEFLTADGSVRNTFRFGRYLPKRHASSFQVRRSLFDEMLLRNAADAGVEVHEETAIRDVDLSDPNRVVATAIGPEKEELRFEARFVVDASGVGSHLGGRGCGKRDEPTLKKISFFAHYENVVPSASGKDAGNTVIVILRDSWVWMIPISPELTSVGVVVDRDRFLESGMQPDAALDSAITRASYVAGRMTSAKRVSQVYSRKDFSFRVDRISGPNYVLIGDAAGFFDPIFSTGVFIAMKTADVAATAVDARLRRGTQRELDRYQRSQDRAIDRYFEFITNFYKREFLEVFLQPSNRFGLLEVVVRVLAGDVFEESLRQRFKLAMFFALTRLQGRTRRIAKPIAWDRLPSTIGAK